jgi:predicted RNase H-like HicB family nuclease
MGTERIHADTGLVLTVHEDESGGFYVLVPALPGCGSQGETEEEALENTGDAIAVVLEVIREDDPDRYEGLLGNSVAGDSTAESSSTVSNAPMQRAAG